MSASQNSFEDFFADDYTGAGELGFSMPDTGFMNTAVSDQSLVKNVTDLRGILPVRYNGPLEGAMGSKAPFAFNPRNMSPEDMKNAKNMIVQKIANLQRELRKSQRELERLSSVKSKNSSESTVKSGKSSVKAMFAEDSGMRMPPKALLDGSGRSVSTLNTSA